MNPFSLILLGPGKLGLQGELTIYAAAELKPALLEALEAHESLEIDLSEVTELDCAGIQIMLLLNNEAQRAGKTLQWVHHAPPVAGNLGLLNLNSLLGEPVSLVWS